VLSQAIAMSITWQDTKDLAVAQLFPAVRDQNVLTSKLLMVAQDAVSKTVPKSKLLTALIPLASFSLEAHLVDGVTESK
jgi:hypothetical protein